MTTKKTPKKKSTPNEILQEELATQSKGEGTQQDSMASFGLQRIFTIKSQLDVFDAPKVFKQAWQPTLRINLDTKSEHMEQNFYFNKTTIGIEGKLEDNDAFKINLVMGGVFQIDGIKDELLDRTLHVLCPSILFPYMREHIDTLMMKSTFPPLMLAPIDFDQLYQKRQEQSNSLSDDGYAPKMPN